MTTTDRADHINVLKSHVKDVIVMIEKNQVIKMMEIKVKIMIIEIN